MKLTRVTITGADDSVTPKRLVLLQKAYPFVEWGILFSQKHEGGPRYPSRAWLTQLLGQPEAHTLALSAHLCGKWVRDLVLEGQNTFKLAWPDAWPSFRRVQLNFHGQYHRACPAFAWALEAEPKEWIFQMDGENDALALKYAGYGRIQVTPLFDRSGGAGVVPKEWPKPVGALVGYAGGLGPDNVVAEFERIQKTCGYSPDLRIWIDMETRVRTADDKKLDLKKVEAVLETMAPHVEKPVSA